MRKLIWGFTLPILMWCVLISLDCGDSVQSGTEGLEIFTTDTIQWKDSLKYGPNSSYVTIEGRYPLSGSHPLLDSVRAWIATNLAENCIFSDEPLFAIDKALLSDGKNLSAVAGKKMIDVTRDDIKCVDEENQDYSIWYEQEYRFMPVYESDSLLIYSFSVSTFLPFNGIYLDIAQTFNRNNGISLTFDNSFIPDSLYRLTDLIKDGLSKQHFKLDIPAEGESARTLDDVLYDPDNFPLPSCPPIFCSDGIRVIYQPREIASFAMGSPACMIPYDIVKPLLRPEVRRLVP